jgi:hypothetical protein
MNTEDKSYAQEAVNPFDPARLRLSQDFGAQLGVKKALITVPVRKPERSWFVRVHPSEEYRLQTAIYTNKEERKEYLVSPELWQGIGDEITPKTLFTALNRQGLLFLWPVTLTQADGRQNEWGRTNLEAAQRAMTKWVRMASNMSAGFYDVFEATGSFPEPEWPDISFAEILKIAFREQYIDTTDHSVLRSLRGEI